MTNLTKRFTTLDTITDAYVHAGIPHDDDAMFIALVKLLNPSVNVHRVVSVPDDLSETSIVGDIGGGRYDHHQSDARCHSNGRKYSACTLFYEDFKDEILKIVGDDSILVELLQDIEYVDNNGAYGMTDYVGCYTTTLFNPLWYEEQDFDRTFDNMVEFYMSNLVTVDHYRNLYGDSYMTALGCSVPSYTLVAKYTSKKFEDSEEGTLAYRAIYNYVAHKCGGNEDIIDNFISENISARFQKEIESFDLAYDEVSSIIESGKYTRNEGKTLILDKFIPWRKAAADNGILFVVFPNNRNGYTVSVPKSNNYAVATLIPMCAENAEYFREDGTLGIYKNFDDAIRAVNMSIWALSSEVDMTNIDSIIKLYVPNNELYCYDTVRAIKSWVNWNNPCLDVALSEYDRVAGFINDCEWSLEDFNLRSWISAKCEKGGVV